MDANLAQEDRWIPTTCGVCYSVCALLVHRVNGTVVKIEGNANSATNRGRLCPRGVRSEEHTSELQSQSNLVCRLLLEKKTIARILKSTRRPSPCLHCGLPRIRHS